RTAELQQANRQLKQEVQERILPEQALKVSETRYREQANQLEIAFRQLQETQSQLVQSEKMSSLGQLVAGVAHEINNPVNFIYGNLRYVAEYAQDLLHLLEKYQKFLPVAPPELESELDNIDL